MSADNYYLIRKHPGGKFVSLMGFMSDEDEPQVDPKRTYTFFSTPEKALEFVSTFGAATEYGVRIHPECYGPVEPTVHEPTVTVNVADLEAALDPLAQTIFREECQPVFARLRAAVAEATMNEPKHYENFIIGRREA
jgi:hypothetical protein